MKYSTWQLPNLPPLPPTLLIGWPLNLIRKRVQSSWLLQFTWHTIQLLPAKSLKLVTLHNLWRQRVILLKSLQGRGNTALHAENWLSHHKNSTFLNWLSRLVWLDKWCSLLLFWLTGILFCYQIAENIIQISRTTGILVDPVYNIKAIRRMVTEMTNNLGRLKGRRILYIHTGTIFHHYIHLPPSDIVFNLGFLSLIKSLPNASQNTNYLLVGS